VIRADSCDPRRDAQLRINRMTKSVMKFAFALALAHARANTVIKTHTAPRGPGGAAQGIVDGRGRLTTSMQYGTDPTGKLVPGGAGAQMRQAMDHIAHVFTAADLEIDEDATSCWLYGFNASTFGNISGSYNSFFQNADSHPARNPTGATLVLEGALVGVSCRGFQNGGKRIAPADFFASDFNAQGLLVDGGAHLFTSAQVGADPVTGDLVPGGAASEARQAMSNLAVVFAAAFPALGAAALAERASECQLMIVNDTGSGAAASVWEAVENEFETFFHAGSRPALSISGFPAGSLPIPALVAATCNGVGASANRTSLASGGGIVERVGGTTLLQANPTYGKDASAAFGATAALFDEAFPHLATAGAPAAALRSAATACELWLADPAADTDAALASLSALFVDLPALTVTKAALPPAGVADSGPVALQCFGSHTN
jgi:enamine deaminase RidA (YjgF/YER057c/UK114 family)